MKDRELVRLLRHTLVEQENVARMKRPSATRRDAAAERAAELRVELGSRIAAGTFETWDALGIDLDRVERRDRGAGSLYFDRSRDRWRCEITVDGRRTVKSHRTREAAEQWLADARQRIERGQDAAASDVTVTDWLTARLDAWSTRLRPKTLANHRYAVETWWTPNVGDVRLIALRKTDVERVISKMVAAGKAPNTVRINTSPLIKALSEAVADPHVGLSVNVAALADRPKIEQAESEFLTPDEARKVLATCADHEHYGDATATAMLLGLRRGEALGLTWDAVDLDADVPTVRIAKQVTIHPDTREVILEAGTKTGTKGQRTIPLPALAVEVLRRRRARQAEAQLRAGAGWSNSHGLVFTNGLGAPIHPDSLTKGSYSITKRAIGRRASPHALRHTAATLLHDAGVPMRTAQAILGHTTEAMTSRVYTHTLDHQLVEGMTALNDLLVREG